MRQARIKVSSKESDAAYHCVTRTVNGEWLFDDVAKEVLRRQIWLAAEYCGVEVVTYVVMSNHFHVLVNVPREEPVADAELLRRYRLLYPKPTAYQCARLDVVEAELAGNGPEAVAWRRRQLALMGDVSQYMKLVKQRFSIWFNKTHKRFGTLWAERFKSVLVEPCREARLTTAAYIDLNAVRAGCVTDPKDYRFCGYAEAVAGSVRARRGIVGAVDGGDWKETQARYREMLFGTGAGARDGVATLAPAELQQVIDKGGALPIATVLRCRLRYLTDGAVLGSRAYVDAQLVAYRKNTGRRERTAPRALPGWMGFGGLATLRGLRQQADG